MVNSPTFLTAKRFDPLVSTTSCPSTACVGGFVNGMFPCAFRAMAVNLPAK